MHCFSAQQGAKQSSHERGAACAARLVKCEIRHTGNRAFHHQDFARARRRGRRRHESSSWRFRVPPFRMLDPGDHSMERYVKHAKTWAEAAKAGVADVE